jgi:hypothetical protein
MTRGLVFHLDARSLAVPAECMSSVVGFRSSAGRSLLLNQYTVQAATFRYATFWIHDPRDPERLPFLDIALRGALPWIDLHE